CKGQDPTREAFVYRTTNLINSIALRKRHSVRKLDGVLNEKHRDIVPDDVPVPFLRVELHGKATDVARQVRRALVASHGREAYEGRGLLPSALKQVGLGDVGKRCIVLEIPTHPEATGMHHALGDALMVEVEELLAEVKIFERRG